MVRDSRVPKARRVKWWVALPRLHMDRRGCCIQTMTLPAKPRIRRLNRCACEGAATSSRTCAAGPARRLAVGEGSRDAGRARPAACGDGLRQQSPQLPSARLVVLQRRAHYISHIPAEAPGQR